MNSMIQISRNIVLAVACLLATSSAFAQGENVPPKVELKLAKTQAPAGSQIKATVIVTFGPGLHGYQNPPSEDYMIPVVVKVDGKEFKLAKPIVYPKGEDQKMGSEKPVKAYSGTIQIPVLITAPAKPGSRDLKIVVTYQQCTDQACFQPGEVSATTKLKITPKGKA